MKQIDYRLHDQPLEMIICHFLIMKKMANSLAFLALCLLQHQSKLIGSDFEILQRGGRHFGVNKSPGSILNEIGLLC